MRQNVFWPAEKPPWTSASVILAYDAIYKISRGSELFLIDGVKRLFAVFFRDLTDSTSLNFLDDDS